MTTLHQPLRLLPRSVKLKQLVKERRKLTARLQKLSGEIDKLAVPAKKRRMSPEALEGLLDELASGPTVAKSLPSDFSRADIYDDHD